MPAESTSGHAHLETRQGRRPGTESESIMCLSMETRHYFRSKDLQSDSHPHTAATWTAAAVKQNGQQKKHPVCGPGQIRRHLNLDMFLEDRLSKNGLKQWILALSKAELTGILAEVPLSSCGTGAESGFRGCAYYAIWSGLWVIALGCIRSSLFLPSPVHRKAAGLGVCAGVSSMPFTLHIRETGMLLNVLSMLAFTPGGGSNTKIRPARSRFTGT